MNDFSDSWTENQLVAAARGKPIPAADEVPDQDESKSVSRTEPATKTQDSIMNSLTVPISSRSQSLNSDTSLNSPNFSPTQSSFPQPSSSSGSALFRGRAKTLAALGSPSKNPQAELTPREMQLPKDPLVNGQPIEAYLYKDASECPICFLYYPPYLNKTRCCDQAICSECFVQIKRPEPHPPEHADPTAPAPPPSGEGQDPDELVSEPAACPFCVQPEFGVTFDSPPFRRGLTYVNQFSTYPLNKSSSAMSSESSLASAMSSGGRMSPISISRRRTTSLSVTSPSVITTDRVRPDWHQKLAAARAHVTRRSNAATALHNAAYLIGNRGQEGDGRGLSGFGRRGILRRTSGADSAPGTASSQLTMLAMMSERYAASGSARDDEGEPSMTPGPRDSYRRNRVDDLEELMMMEAIRMSLASEEVRRTREEKERKKNAKKEEKENKKAAKAAKKAGVYPSSANRSTAGIDGTTGEASTSQLDFGSSTSKGKIPNNTSDQAFSSSPAEDPQEHLERARAQILPTDISSAYSSSAYRPSQLRTLSNASSSASSIEGSAPGSSKSDLHGQGSSFNVSPNASGVNMPSGGSAQVISETPPGGGAGMESMFNFRSLAAMVGDDDKYEKAVHEENTGEAQNLGERSGSMNATAQRLNPNKAVAPNDDFGLRLDDTANRPFESSGMELPSFHVTASSRTNSDFDDTKYAAIGTESISRDDVHT